MSKHPPTPEQQMAIDERGKTLLVSAAAGAGKTTTLTNRIIDSLLDVNHPADISRMLVITYTKASAADLRAHVRDALREACEKNPQNTRLAEQLSALPSAQISTVDSFFFRILREHAEEAGVSPTLRIADEAEIAILMRDTMARLINRLYSGEEECMSAEDFCRLAEVLTDPREETTLGDILLRLYKTCANFPERTGYLTRLAEASYDTSLPLEETVWVKYIFAQTKAMCETAKVYLAAAGQRVIDEEPDAKPGIDNALKSDCALLSNIAESTEVSFAQTREAVLAFKAAKLSVKAKGEAYESFKKIREIYKATVAKFGKQFYAFPPSAWKAAMAEMHDYNTLACKVIDRFTALYEAEKNRRRICDFSDLEHKLCALLYEDDKPSKIALSIGDEFDYVYVDEYQDINRMQHRIISAISKPNNRFMVGDIKQSIYSFRRAEPSLFASMKKSFPLLSKGEENPCASIYLSKNFRSTQKTVDGINCVFDFLFSHAGESIGYEHEDRLICGNGKEGDAEPRLVLCYRRPEQEEDEATKKEQAQVSILQEAEGDEGDDEEYGPSAEEDSEEEAEFVANEIARLLSLKKEDGETPRYKPGDVAILLRSLKKKTNHYVKALTERGIAVELADVKEFFLVPEVLLCLCLLNAVNNPQRDIYLAGLMQSPLYGFTQDDLTHIRMETGVDMPLYYSLIEYSKNHTDEEAPKRLLEDLKRYRALSECVPVDRLLRRMYDETGLLSLSKAKQGGRENLLLLYHYARSFEGSEFKGLHAFIDYLNQMIQTNNSIKTPARAVADPNKVRMMTIHASKGLEFPATFVCGMGNSFNEMELKNKTLFHPAFGLSFTLRDKTGFVAMSSPIREVVKSALRRSGREEELRVLYVALTRAVERLYMTARTPKDNAVERLMERIRMLKDAPTEWHILEARNYFQTVAAAWPFPKLELEMPDSKTDQKDGASQEKTASPDVAAETGKNEEASQGTVPSDAAEEKGEGESNSEQSFSEEELYAELESRFGFVYPYSYLHKIPGKIAVSKLSPVVLDGTEEEMLHLEKAEETRILPRFYQPSEGYSPAEMGTATHQFMQFCRFDLLRQNGAQAELERLRKEGFIDEKSAKLVRLYEIERFRKSPFMEELLSAKSMKREFRFHVSLPADEYTADEMLKFQLSGETILVQGVIDCMLFDEQGEITLIDYKTDRLTKEELADVSLAKAKLFDRHCEQLKYYALAIAQIFGKAPCRIGLYSLPAGQVFWLEA